MISREVRAENLSTKHQIRENFSGILFDDCINFPILFRNRFKWPPLAEWQMTEIWRDYAVCHKSMKSGIVIKMQ